MLIEMLVGPCNPIENARFVALGSLFFSFFFDSRLQVAGKLTQEHYDALGVAFGVSPREYAYMRRCKTLEDLRERTKVGARDEAYRDESCKDTEMSM